MSKKINSTITFFKLTVAPVTPIFAQKLLMASAGNPLLLRAARVNSLGSSQSAQIPEVMSLPIFLLLTTV